MERYPGLKDAVLDLDPVLIRTLAAFTLDRRSNGWHVLFRFAFFGPNLERPADVEQYPDVRVMLPWSIDPEEEIRGLEESDIVGSFNALRMGEHQWLVKTHAGSQAERIQWRNSIG